VSGEKRRRRELAVSLSEVLDRRALTLDELEERFEGVASRRQIIRELDRLVGRLVLCSKRGEDGVQVYESWGRVIERMKSSRREGPRSARPRGRRADRIA
jgi:hypothetical protein